ncbi:NAD-dependent epimerase/dehydratase family protein [Streptomyces sasae]|uniref:NAD-dependent epimerase/dehydratase family protein n=1 Tax=Streptomyces sasae TaxID=1266772 RepID=UPI002931DF7E|nr:NAD-dependent epimerase/dehydratase family protein [Streptomyces sasae]
MSPLVLVTGSGGFVGGHAAAAAHVAGDVRLRLLVRKPPPGTGTPVGHGRGDRTGHVRRDRTGHVRRDRTDYVRGDLTDPASLRGVCDGVDAVVHCASQVGGDPGQLRRVNDLGTRALVEEARRAGVGRFVYLSTAAVLGRGPFHGVRPGEVPIAPLSDTSRTRAAAERHVLAAGGTVLRPHLVYGVGDRWVVPGLLALLRQLGARPHGWGGRQSMIDAGTLGRVLMAAALSPTALAGRVRFVNHPEPVPGSLLVSAVADLYGLLPAAVSGIPAETASARVRADRTARHHLELLAADHWFADDRVWTDLGCDPGAGFAERLPRYADWYRSRRPVPDHSGPLAAVSTPAASAGS